MPKWNTENPQAKEYLLGAVAKWTRMGIDGWRLDVATEVDSHFWREFRETVRGINPDALIIGEFWRNSEAWLQGDQYDGGPFPYGQRREYGAVENRGGFPVYLCGYALHILWHGNWYDG